MIKPGRYNMQVLIWTSIKQKPDITESFDFSISQEQAAKYNLNDLTQTSHTTEISIREINRKNSILAESQAKSLYGNDINRKWWTFRRT